MRIAPVLKVLLSVAVLSCQSGSQPEPVQYSVPADVEPYIQAFRNEAQQRNYSVSTANLIVTFGSTQSEDVCGECLQQMGKTPRITLHANDYCWKDASVNERECLVFHELGHCLLNRAHKTDRLPNGASASLMNPGDMTIYATCRYPIDDTCDKRPRRSYYIDELFDPATPTPVWGK